MIDLGESHGRRSASDPDRAGEHHALHPGDRVTFAGQVTVDSGVLDPVPLAAAYVEATGRTW